MWGGGGEIADLNFSSPLHRPQTRVLPPSTCVLPPQAPLPAAPTWSSTSRRTSGTTCQQRPSRRWQVGGGMNSEKGGGRGPTEAVEAVAGERGERVWLG